MRLEDVDLTDLDLFADGFPHHVFHALRRKAPVWWHEATVHTPDGQGFWVLSRHAEVIAAAADATTSDPGHPAPAGCAERRPPPAGGVDERHPHLRGPRARAGE